METHHQGRWNGTFIRYVNVSRFLENLSALLSSSFLPLLLEREKKIIMRAKNKTINCWLFYRLSLYCQFSCAYVSLRSFLPLSLEIRQHYLFSIFKHKHTHICTQNVLIPDPSPASYLYETDRRIVLFLSTEM